MKILLKLLKVFIIFIVLFLASYVLCVLVVILGTYFFFRGANPNVGIVLFVYGLLIPAVSISLAIIGTARLMKKSKKAEVIKGGIRYGD